MAQNYLRNLSWEREINTSNSKCHSTSLNETPALALEKIYACQFCKETAARQKEINLHLKNKAVMNSITHLFSFKTGFECMFYQSCKE